MGLINESNGGVIILTSIICFVSVILSGIIIIRSLKHKPGPKFMIDGILILGLASFSYPAFRLIYGLYITAETIKEGGEISVSLTWEGIGNVIPTIAAGFIALHISIICWFIVRRFSNLKSK
jgi:hypothetical protein